jgi:hypothetical protein
MKLAICCGGRLFPKLCLIVLDFLCLTYPAHLPLDIVVLPRYDMVVRLLYGAR